MVMTERNNQTAEHRSKVLHAGETAIEKAILLCAVTSTISVALITIFIFKSGLPVLSEYGLGNFITGTAWKPTSGQYGILPLIAGTLSVTAGALIIGVPTGIACAVFLAELLPKPLARAFSSAIELLAGIPSVVYGFFGLAVLVPIIRGTLLPIWQLINPEAATTGFSILAGAIILAIMILPTIVSLSANAINAVPGEYREASLALGGNRRETITKVILPAAKSGIVSSIILGMGRAIGETMAVLLITGNMAKMPGSIFDSVATLTGTIAMEMSYAGPQHQQALFAIGIILFVIIMLLNMLAQALAHRLGGGER